jgi:hypothetical protein
MQKLSGNSFSKNNKSCSTFHQQSNKIEFAFFSEFSMVFYGFSKFQYFGNTIEDWVFRLGPWKLWKLHNHALAVRFGP